MSRRAIAAALAREDLSSGERLVAFSLASFADRKDRARPGTLAAAGRAGLARSGFLEARDRLVGRGLVIVEELASGRGRASTVALRFAHAGPWWEGEINAELFEAVLGYSRAQGPARLLVAAMAALADQRRVVEGLTTERLCAAAGISDRTYRRAHGPLLASGELVLRRMTRGRGNTNSWEIPDPRSRGAVAGPRLLRRVAPPAGARPLLATVTPPLDLANANDVVEPLDADRALRPGGGGEGGQDRTLCAENRPGLSGVRGGKGCQDRTVAAQNRPGPSGVSALNPCQDRTLSPENPAENPAKNPAAIARAGSEPQNPRTPEDPPNPPEGGSRADQILVRRTCVTERGRERRRLVAVDLAAVRAGLRAAGEADLAAWEQVRAIARAAVGESTFEIWLERLALIAVDLERTLIVSVPTETVGWVACRFGRVLDDAAERAGRGLRVAEEAECKAAESLGPAPGATIAAAIGPSGDARFSPHASSDGCAADVHTPLSGGVPSDPSRDSPGARSNRRATYTSAYPSSYPEVYTQSKEVS